MEGSSETSVFQPEFPIWISFMYPRPFPTSELPRGLCLDPPDVSEILVMPI